MLAGARVDAGDLGLPVLTDVAASAGIDVFGSTGPAYPGYVNNASVFQRNFGNGAAAGDYDGDGDLDLYLLRYEGFSNILLRNNLDQGATTFTDVTTISGIGDLGLSRVAHFADLDDDGWLDLVLLNDNDELGTHSTSKIYRNNGDGTFTDVTIGSGFEPLGNLRCGMSLADYDQDGRLDIYVTNWGFFPLKPGDDPPFPGRNELYRNLGNFTFENVTDDVGLGLASTCFTAIFMDFDDDDRPDIYVTIDTAPDGFYWNTPTGFVEAAATTGTTHLGNDMGAVCVDFDEDGDPDIYTTNIREPTWPSGFGGNCYYVNQRAQSGTTMFTDEAWPRGVAETYWGWGVEGTDIDNDGDADIVAANGLDEHVANAFGTDSEMYESSTVILLNEAGGWQRMLLGDTDDSRALIAFDYDRDGDQDFLTANVEDPVRLWQNDTAGLGHWLDVAVVQTVGQNRNGIGVTMWATFGTKTLRHDILAGESFLAGTPAEAHFGLGDSSTVDELRIEWTDGSESTFADIAADQRIVVSQLIGDLDRNGQVGFSDLAAVLNHWGPCPAAPTPCSADLNFDGLVGFADLSLLLSLWG